MGKLRLKILSALKNQVVRVYNKNSVVVTLQCGVTTTEFLLYTCWRTPYNL
jgi:hypothetical protein